MKKNIWLLLAAGIFGTLLIIFVVRVTTAKSEAVHYHADFSLYINGVRDEFNGPGFYEEVQTCSLHDSDNPRARVHMHNHEAGIVHIHDHTVTWSAFMANLGYTLGDNVVATTQGIFTDGTDGNELKFILNGKPVDTVANRVIGNEDVLLVNYGKDDDASIRKKFDSIPRNAHEENQGKDPSSCGGASVHLTFTDRVKKAVKFWQ